MGTQEGEDRKGRSKQKKQASKKGEENSRRARGREIGSPWEREQARERSERNQKRRKEVQRKAIKGEQVSEGKKLNRLMKTCM